MQQDIRRVALDRVETRPFFELSADRLLGGSAAALAQAECLGHMVRLRAWCADLRTQALSAQGLHAELGCLASGRVELLFDDDRRAVAYACWRIVDTDADGDAAAPGDAARGSDVPIRRAEVIAVVAPFGHARPLLRAVSRRVEAEGLRLWPRRRARGVYPGPGWPRTPEV